MLRQKSVIYITMTIHPFNCPAGVNKLSPRQPALIRIDKVGCLIPLSDAHSVTDFIRPPILTSVFVRFTRQLSFRVTNWQFFGLKGPSFLMRFKTKPLAYPFAIAHSKNDSKSFHPLHTLIPRPPCKGKLGKPSFSHL